jgi:hypothetical protein
MSEQQAAQKQPEPKPVSKWTPAQRSINDIIADLRKPIAAEHLKQKKAGGNQITFLPWYNAIKYLDFFAPGWSYRITGVHHAGQNVVVVAEISIPTSDGVITRQATGIEDDDKEGYGDPSSNAESMALRRAAAKFGLALYLYDKK